MRLALLALLALLASASLAPASAQEPAPSPHDDDEEDEPPSREERERFEERLRLMRMVALTEALALDEATAAKLFPYLRDTDAAQGKLHLSVREHRRALRTMAKAERYDAREIDAHLAALGTAEQEMARLRSEQVAGLTRILSAEQRLKYVLTRAHLERELRDVLRERGSGRRERGERRGRGGE